MPIAITDDATQFPAVTAPSDSDAVGTVQMQVTAQKLANRTASLKARVDAIAPGTGSAPGGTTLLFHVADVASMVAIAHPADRSICLVDGYGLFQYKFADYSNAPPWQVEDGGGPDGSWWLLPIGVLGVANGLAQLDGTARVPAANVRNGVIATYGTVVGTSGLSYATTTSTTLVNIGSASVAVASAAVGDVLMFVGSVTIIGGSSGGSAAITVTDSSGATVVQKVPFVASTEGTVSLCGRFPVTHAGTQTVSLQFLSASGAATQTAIGQASLNVTHLRP